MLGALDAKETVGWARWRNVHVCGTHRYSGVRKVCIVRSHGSERYLRRRTGPTTTVAPSVGHPAGTCLDERWVRARIVRERIPAIARLILMLKPEEICQAAGRRRREVVRRSYRACPSGGRGSCAGSPSGLRGSQVRGAGPPVPERMCWRWGRPRRGREGMTEQAPRLLPPAAPAMMRTKLLDPSSPRRRAHPPAQPADNSNHGAPNGTGLKPSGR